MMKHRLTLLLALLVLGSSLAALAAAYGSLKSSETLADESLRSLGLSLARAVESAGRDSENPSLSRDLFNRILSDDLVAYAQITAPDGIIRFHTNPDLEGGFATTSPGANEEAPSRQTLGTGETTFEMKYPLLLSGRPHLLSLHVRTVNADRITGRARTVFGTVILVVTLLWIVGALGLWLFVRQSRIERQLLQNEHLALIGQMSAVLAHELRNALGSIKGYAQYLDEKMPEGSPGKTATDIIVKESRRIETLVSELLNYSRSFEVFRTETTLDAIVQQARTCLPTDSIAFNSEGVVGILLQTDPEKLVSVFQNVFLNAAEAMNGAGRIDVRADRMRQTLNIEIQDEGPGIQDVTRHKAFLPFFTTKTRGTGLGLAYCRKVIDALGGTIEIRNRSDRTGAVVRLTLPL